MLLNLQNIQLCVVFSYVLHAVMLQSGHSVTSWLILHSIVFKRLFPGLFKLNFFNECHWVSKGPSCIYILMSILTLLSSSSYREDFSRYYGKYSTWLKSCHLSLSLSMCHIQCCVIPFQWNNSTVPEVPKCGPLYKRPILLGWRDSKTHLHAGLNNDGNTCYVNATLQVRV